MKILLTEDIGLQGEWLRDELCRSFRCEVIWIQTESEFQLRLDEIERISPDVAIFDVMLKWAEPSPDAPPVPPGWDRHRAGLNCQKLLSNREGTKNTPAILYTVLGIADLGPEDSLPGMSFLSKDSDLEPLFQRIREVTASLRP
jgi:hypothetical protein